MQEFEELGSATARQPVSSTGFPERLREAFDNANNADIARRLSTSDATIKPYTDGTRIPVPDMLLKIQRATGVNLHWLLTGQGPRRVEREAISFSAADEKKIRELARSAGRTFEEEVALLATAALDVLRKI